MIKLKSTIFMLCSATFLINADQISLNGTIKDAKGFVIAGAVISLASDASIKDTSDAKGEFVLGNDKTAISKDGTNKIFLHNTVGVTNVVFRENQLVFLLLLQSKTVISRFFQAME